LAGLISRQVPSTSKQDGTYTDLWRWQTCEPSRHSRGQNLAYVTADVAYCQATERTSGMSPADNQWTTVRRSWQFWTTHCSGPNASAPAPLARSGRLTWQSMGPLHIFK